MIDRSGHDFNALCQIQEQQLTAWSSRIVPSIFFPVRDYVRSHNTKAKACDQQHRVFRGQDLIELFLHWPKVKSPYPVPVNPLDEV